MKSAAGGPGINRGRADNNAGNVRQCLYLGLPDGGKMAVGNALARGNQGADHEFWGEEDRGLRPRLKPWSRGFPARC